ncbi:MAG: DUF1730 domain-containing protein [Firmicutes bacterium]|nr:DUF1730 domain-containing protein [Bacillota bacterium]
MITQKQLEEFAQQNNVIAGMTGARVFDELKKPLERKVPFVSYSLEERIDPALTLENAKTVICLGYPYPREITTDRGISIAAAGMDYHTLVMSALENLKAFLGIDGLAFADTGPLVDRYVAYLCGLGHYGKNGFIINEKFGTLFFIGYIITTDGAESYNTPQNGSCGDCRRCLDACPTGAINGGEMAYESCISCLTQIKGVLSREQMKSMRGQVYGCDVCQLSCPKNRGRLKINLRENDYTHFFELTNKQFREKYGSTGIAWRGRATIVRNAINAHINTGGSKEDIKIFLTDNNEVLRETAKILLDDKK